MRTKRNTIRQKGSVFLVALITGFIFSIILLAIDPTIREFFVQERSQDGLSPADSRVDSSDSAIEQSTSSSPHDGSAVSTVTKKPVTNILPQKEKVDAVVNTPPSVTVVSKEEAMFSEKYLPRTGDVLNARTIISLTNNERQKEGRGVLKENADLNLAATAKINHMFDNQYFEHVAPSTMEDVTYWTEKAGYVYISVGENLAMGDFDSEEEMVTAWMNSPGHRENILKSSYEEIGVAVGRGTYQGNTVWMGVQVFGIPASSCPNIDDSLIASVNSTKVLIQNIEKELALLLPLISNVPQPKTQEEYDAYVANVTKYNDLVSQHQRLSDSATSLVNAYNEEVRRYNACLSSK